MSTFDITYLGWSTFLAECATCDWQSQGSLAACREAAVRHVRTAHQ